MAYIGRAPTSGTFLKQDITSDGSTTTFTLQNTVGNESALLVSVGGVIQEPKVAYTLATGGTQIVFSTAPSATDNVYIHFLGNSVTQNLNNVRGSEFILDADGDTSFTADTDDEIDIQVGGTDRSTIKTTGFHNIDSYKFVAGTGDDLEIYHDGTNSFIANKTGALKLATETSGIAITIGHTTSEVTIADNATVAGNLTVTGTLTQTGTQTFDGGIDVDNFNINGTTIALSTGDMILDSAGDIILDVDGADILFKDDGTTYGSLTNTSGNLIIKSGTTTAATFAGANVTFAGTIDSGAITSTGVVTATGFTIGSAVITETELEILDGLAATTAELAVIDGGTSATATTVAAADRVVLNDNGTMVQAAVTDLDTFFSASSKTLTNKTLTSPVISTIVGSTITLDSAGDIVLDADGGDVLFKDAGTTFGSATNTSGNLIIKSGTTTAATFAGANVTLAGTVDSGAITSTGIVTGTAFTAGSAVLAEAELELLDGLTAGTAIASKVVTTDANIDSTGMRNLTISGEIDAATGDFSGAVDVAGATTVVALTASGIIKTDDATDATSTTDGSLQTDGGLSVAKDAVIGDDLLLLSDASVIKFGANSEVTLTHEHDVGLILGGAAPVFTIGDGGAEDTQLRFDGNAQNFAIGIDDSTDKLTISKGNTLGTTVAMTIDENALITLPDGAMEIIASGNYANLTLTTTDADANFGPELRLYRNSANPADDDVIGIIDFEGKDSGGNDTIYARIQGEIMQESDGSEDGQLQFDIMKAGTVRNLFMLDRGSVVVNEDSQDVDFRVESNGNANMLFVDAGNDKVGVGTASPQTTLHVEGTAPILRISDSNSTSEADATGAIQFYDRNNTDINNSITSGDGSSNDFFITNHNSKSIIFSSNGAEGFRITNGQQLSSRDAAPDVNQGGLCLQQGGDDGNILSFKSSDVAHAITAIAETDTWLDMRKNSDGGGGLLMRNFSETAIAFRHLVVASGSNTAESTSATSYWSVDARKNANNTNVTGLDADDNLASFRQSDEAQFIIKGDGELFSNQSATVGTYDAYDDAQLVRAYDLNHMQGVINSKFDKFVQYNKDDLQKARLIGTDDDGNATPMVNVTGMQRLHNGAIWQQYEATQKLTQAMYELAKETLGEEKAKTILDKHEVKLLN